MSRYLLLLSLLISTPITLAETIQIDLLAATCAACHGTEGRSISSNKSLAGIDKAYFMAQMDKFKSGERQGTVMNTYSQGLSDSEIELLAEFFSHKQP